MDVHASTRWIATERFAPFLESAHGDAALALDLYLWHARVAGASMTTLHHFEVALRNTIDLQLSAPGLSKNDRRASGGVGWLLEPATLSPQAIVAVRKVIARLQREGYLVEHSRIVASLPFSFWKGLFARRYESLWRTRLHHAFPGAGLRREILEPLTNLHLWRNRIAHHDSLLSQDIGRRLGEMIDIANAIDPGCGSWLGAHTEIATLLKQRPVSPCSRRLTVS